MVILFRAPTRFDAGARIETRWFATRNDGAALRGAPLAIMLIICFAHVDARRYRYRFSFAFDAYAPVFIIFRLLIIVTSTNYHRLPSELSRSSFRRLRPRLPPSRR